jgi:hypothetical protein
MLREAKGKSLREKPFSAELWQVKARQTTIKDEAAIKVICSLQYSKLNIFSFFCLQMSMKKEGSGRN